MDTSYLTQQVTSIIGQLHNLFDEIGVPSHERDSRESELFSSLSETLHNHLRLVASEKNALVEEGQRIITTIKQMEASLDDTKNNNLYAPKNDELKVSYPLIECLQSLKEKHKTISKLHQERYAQVKKLIQALESYSSHLEPSFLKVKLPPVASDGTVPPSFDLSPNYINAVDAEFTRVYEEYTRRVANVQQISEDIVKLWAELGTPQAQTDATIVQCYRDAPEQLGLHQEDIANLQSRREKLLEEKRAREKRVKELRTTVEELWERLNVDERERKAFSASTRGCGLRTINDLEDELARLNELKRQNLHIFVEDARTRLQTLWDELFFSEEEAVEFTPMFCDVYSDALLSAHEGEIQRLETLKEQRAPTLQLVSKHKGLVRDRDDLAASSQDASRLLMKPQKGEKRDPTRLLREEKMRKRIAKELPKVEIELTKVLENWEEEYGRPFLVFGERYLDTIEESSARAAPPPRSKTPNGLPPRSKTPSAMGPPPKPAPKSAASKETSKREPPTLRSKTPTSTAPKAAPPSTTKAAANNKSPSRIPARAPLGNMPHGSNSPERSNHPRQPAQSKENNAARKMEPPMMAPPPKMRNLHAPSPAPTPSYPDDVTRSGSVVRGVEPEDPYSDHHLNRSYAAHPYPRPPPGFTQPYQHTGALSASTASSSRQISATSSAATALSSENWETFDEASDVESALQLHRQGYAYNYPAPPHDGGEAYYAHLRGAAAAAAGKRMAEGEAGRAAKVLRAGSGESGWTDEVE